MTYTGLVLVILWALIIGLHSVVTGILAIEWYDEPTWQGTVLATFFVLTLVCSVAGWIFVVWENS